MKKQIKLKPCPWCGKTPQVIGSYHRWISCTYGCPVLPSTRDVYETDKEAIKVWNTRKKPKVKK